MVDRQSLGDGFISAYWRKVEDMLMRFTFILVAVTGLGVVRLPAQNGPPPVIEIFREAIKEGRGPAHEKVEADYSAAFRKANHPAHYIALTAMSGPSEVWFVQPTPSFGATEDYEKASEKEPLKSGLAMLEARDGELRASSRAIWAAFRPDLSYHPEKFACAKPRYVMVGTFRLRLGRDADFVAGAKQYFGAFEKANIDQCILAYQVVAGAPSGTYLFFTMMDSMKAMDEQPARMQAVQQAMGADTFAQFMKGSGDLFVSTENTLLEVKPGMSYPSQQMIDSNPDFWKTKPAAKPAAAAPAPEKKQ
jgi:hypothetical protein